MLYSGLFKTTANGVELDLATDYHVEKDAAGEETIWVISLRKDVKFSDGTPLTADDVVDTLTYAKTRPQVSQLVSFYNDVEKVDDYTIKLNTNGVYATVPDSLATTATFILPSELIAAGHDFNNNPVGSGPYKFVEWKKSEYVLLTINDNWYGEKPTIKNIKWNFIAESSSRVLALESGQVDFIVDADALDVERLQADPKYDVSISNGSMFTYFLLQGTKEPFNDVNFRKFLASAIDRNDVIAVALNGFGTPLVGCINVNIDGTTDENACAFNKEKAKEYLAAWGGDPKSVNFEVLVSNDTRRKVAENIQSQLAEYGISFSIKTTESATCSSLAKTGEYDAMIFAYTTNDFATYCKNLYYISEDSNAGNYFRMSGDDSLNAMIDVVNTTTDAAARKGYITDYVKALNERQPVVPIFCNQVLIAYDSHLKGLSVDSLGLYHVEYFSWE